MSDYFSRKLRVYLFGGCKKRQSIHWWIIMFPLNFFLKWQFWGYTDSIYGVFNLWFVWFWYNDNFGIKRPTPTEADGNLPAGERNLSLFLLSVLTCSLIKMQRKKWNLFTGKYYLETICLKHIVLPQNVDSLIYISANYGFTQLIYRYIYIPISLMDVNGLHKATHITVSPPCLAIIGPLHVQELLPAHPPSVTDGGKQ